MRISDWSSDVCSSDLECRRPGVFEILHGTGITCGNGRRVADVLIGMELRFGIPGRTQFLEQRGSLFGNFTRSRQGTKRSIHLRRSEERRVGKECVSAGTSRRSKYTQKKKKKKK